MPYKSSKSHNLGKAILSYLSSDIGSVIGGDGSGSSGGANLGPSDGNGTIEAPVITSPTQGEAMVNPLTVTLQSGYTADPADPYEKTVLVVSRDADFTDVIWAQEYTNSSQTSFAVNAVIESNETYYLRVSFYSTSLNRAETNQSFVGDSSIGELEFFAFAAARTSDGDLTVTAPGVFANHGTIQATVYLADGGNGSSGSGGGCNGTPGGAGGSGQVLVAQLPGSSLGWTSGQTFTFSSDFNSPIYSDAYKFTSGGGGTVSLNNTPGGSSATTVSQAYTELAALQAFYTFSSGSAGSSGGGGGASGSGATPGSGGTGGGGGVVFTNTGSPGAPMFPPGTVIDSGAPSSVPSNGNPGSSGSTLTSCRAPGDRSFGAGGGSGGTGYGAGGGGGGAGGGTCWGDWCGNGAPGGPGGAGNRGMMVVVFGTRYSGV